MFDINPSSNISISTGTIIRFFVIVIFLVSLYYLSSVVLVVLAAVVFASSIEPIVRRLKRLRFHRIAAVVSIYLSIILIVAGLFVFFLPMVVNDISGFLNEIPKTITFEDLWSPIRDIGLNLNPISQSLSVHTISLSDFVNSLKTSIGGTSASAFHTASVIFGGLLSFILIVVISFYLVVQEEGVDDFLRIVAPVRRHDYIIDLWKRSQRKIGLWLQGKIILGIVVGVLVYAILVIVGIPHALSLAVLAAIFEIIPVFGPIISSIPAILVAFSDNGMGTGILLVVLYIVVYQLESQLFYPLVVRKVVGINPVVVILALIIGAKLAGILGALIAVPLSAALMEYVNDIEKHKKAEAAERGERNKQTVVDFHHVQ
ncbi:MAG: AI-2E family transporter [Candidatus Taylorbacteria bacterium]|nr:AI-2E family transporter [Candidatus Taylorbacteria bacterium]